MDSQLTHPQTEPTRTRILYNGLRYGFKFCKTSGREHVVVWTSNVIQLSSIDIPSNAKREHCDVLILEPAGCYWKFCEWTLICCLLAVSDNNCDLQKKSREHRVQKVRPWYKGVLINDTTFTTRRNGWRMRQFSSNFKMWCNIPLVVNTTFQSPVSQRRTPK